MDVYIGTTGLKESFEEPFPETKECPKCGGEARIMFVAAEEGGLREKVYICSLHKGSTKGSNWLHDACCVAVYLCRECFEVTGLINQA